MVISTEFLNNVCGVKAFFSYIRRRLYIYLQIQITRSNDCEVFSITYVYLYEHIFVVKLQMYYKVGDYIIRQGARGDTFFIISKGKVSYN